MKQLWYFKKMLRRRGSADERALTSRSEVISWRKALTVGSCVCKYVIIPALNPRCSAPEISRWEKTAATVCVRGSGLSHTMIEFQKALSWPLWERLKHTLLYFDLHFWSLAIKDTKYVQSFVVVNYYPLDQQSYLSCFSFIKNIFKLIQLPPQNTKTLHHTV